MDTLQTFPTDQPLKWSKQILDFYSQIRQLAAWDVSYKIKVFFQCLHKN